MVRTHRCAIAIGNGFRQMAGTNERCGIKVSQRARHFQDADAGAGRKRMLRAGRQQHVAILVGDTTVFFQFTDVQLRIGYSGTSQLNAASRKYPRPNRLAGFRGGPWVV